MDHLHRRRRRHGQHRHDYTREHFLDLKEIFFSPSHLKECRSHTVAVEGVLPGLRFVEALIRSGHDLLKDVVDGGASAAATTASSTASSSAAADVAVAAAGASVVDVPIFGGQMSATWEIWRKWTL